MKFIKQFPYISSLLIFSIALVFIGIYAALIMSISNTNRRRPHVYPEATYGGGSGNTSSVPKRPASSENKSNSSQTTVIKKTGTAAATYYNDRDMTITQTDYASFRKIGSDEFTIVAYFESNGFTLEEPKNVWLRMVLLAKNNNYATDRTFKIFLDGELFYNTESELEDSNMDKKSFNISLNKDIPYYLFVHIAKANRVRLQVGTTLIDLKEKELQSFRDLVELVEGDTVTEEVKVEAPPPPRQERREVLRPAH